MNIPKPVADHGESVKKFNREYLEGVRNETNKRK